MTFICKFCEKIFDRSVNCRMHEAHCVGENCAAEAKCSTVKKTKSAFGSKFVQLTVDWNGQNTTLDMLAEQIGGLTHLTQINIFLTLVVVFKTIGGLVSDPPVYLNSTIEQMFFTDPLGIIAVLNVLFNQFDALIQDYEQSGSGWVFDKIVRLEANIAKYNPLRSGTFVETPKWIAKKKAVVNVKNNDQYCIIYSILAKLYPSATHVSEAYSYRRNFDKIEKGEIEFPIDLKDVPKLAELNRIHINVFSVGEKNCIIPLFVSPTKADYQQEPVNLLLLQDGCIQHYCLIKNFSRLMKSQHTRHEHKLHYCFRCMLGFSTEKRLQDHKSMCEKMRVGACKLPTKEPYLRFKNYHRAHPPDFYIVCDFESLLVCEGDELYIHFL